MTGEVTIAVPDAGTNSVTDRLGLLFDTHHQRLYRLARRMSRDRDEARDLVQEAFLRAARAPASIPAGATSEEAWLVRVLVNLCRDRWRRRAARNRLGASDEGLHAPAAVNPENALVARSVIWHALRALPARRRAVVILYELEGATIEVIARLLGITRTTVRWHLAAGRRQLANAVRNSGTKA
jgi:RNA polymerase sigma-70 factor (ECF subfamily)